jgi:protein phosphatase
MNADDAPPCFVNWSGLTDRGRFRENNEDAFLALTFDAEGVRFLGKEGQGSLQEADFVFAVSDGMGGAKSGEFASRIAVDKITKLLPRSFHQRARGLPTGFPDILETLMHSIHEEMTSLGKIYEECHGMGATLTLGWLVPGWLYYAHIGDSRLYHLPAAGGIRQVTQDDSHVGWLRSTGKINEREARMHPRKNVLSRALGGGHQFAEAQIGAVGCEPGDLFLFCTDGVTDGMWDRALLDALREPDASAARLSHAARIVHNAVAESGRDNTTAVVIGIA